MVPIVFSRAASNNDSRKVRLLFPLPLLPYCVVESESSDAGVAAALVAGVSQSTELSREAELGESVDAELVADAFFLGKGRLKLSFGVIIALVGITTAFRVCVLRRGTSDSFDSSSRAEGEDGGMTSLELDELALKVFASASTVSLVGSVSAES